MMHRTDVGIPALHMAASPTEDSTARTKTVTPDSWTWDIDRPFPRSHIKCRTPFNEWYMRGKTSTNFAAWISAGPKHRDFASIRYDSKFPGSSSADRPKRETPPLMAIPEPRWQTDIAMGRDHL